MFTMKKVALATILLVVMGQAYATGNSNQGNTTNNNQTYNNATSSNHNTNLNTNHNANVNTQGQQQGQLQGQAQGQAQSTNNSNNASQTTTFVDNEARNPVNSAISSNMSPSAQCMGVATGAVSGPGISVSLGKSYESKQCNQRELVRVLSQLGQNVAALQVACSIEGAEVTDLCKTYQTKTTIIVPQAFKTVTFSPLTGQ
jgi:hypothetical protein